MVEMGWVVLMIVEEFGGMGFGYVGLGQILEESGCILIVFFIVFNLLLGVSMIQIGGFEVQKQVLLLVIVEGQLILMFVFEEQSVYCFFVVFLIVEQKDG